MRISPFAKVRLVVVAAEWVLIATMGLVPALGQQGNATLVGQVQDASGATVPRAKVLAKNIRTGIERSTTTNDSGEYTIPALDTGEFKVTVSAAGFRSAVQEHVVLRYQQSQRVDVTMSLGDVAEQVDVTSTPTQLQTENATASTIIDQTKVRELPLNGRNFIQLAQLVPGTTPGAPGDGNTSFAGTGFTVSAAGQRDFNNEYTLDGVSMSETRNPAPAFLPSVDAIQEFNVQTGLFSAEYGYKAGAHVDIAIKSGTNQYHGNVFEFLRNSVFDARNYFGTQVDPLKRNQFGGTFGGRIIRDRTFFFVAYDGTRQRQDITTSSTVPDPAQLSGNFSGLHTPVIDPTTNAQFPGNVIPASRIDGRAALMAPYFPAPNRSGQPNYTFNGAAPDDTDQFFIRVDHKLTEHDNVFARYAYSNRQFSTPPSIEPFGTATPIRAQNASVQEIHLFTPSMINQFQLGYNRYHRENVSEQRFVSLANQLAIPGVDQNPSLVGFPVVNITGYAAIGEGTYNPLQFYNELEQLKDTFSYVRGAHSFKAGIDFLHIRNQQTFPLYPRGQFGFTGGVTGNPVADFVLGLPLTTQVSAGLTPARIFTTFYDGYILDDWKVKPNLTINLGLRYEANMPVQDQRGLARNFDLATGTLFPAPGVRTRLYRFDDNNFAPRLGIAYRPGNSEKWVIRAGTGVFYSTPEFNTVVDFNLNPPFFTTDQFRTSPATVLTLANPFPSGSQQAAGAPSIYSIDANDYRDAFTLEWTFGIQRQITRSLSFDATYMGSKTTGLLGDLLINQATPGTGSIQLRRRFPQYAAINYWTPIGFSTYHSLQLKAEQRFANGLTFLAAYTYGKAIDLTGSPIFGDTVAGGPQQKGNIFENKGLAGYDIRHRLVVSYDYALPVGRGKQFLATANRLVDGFLGGWQLNGITTVQTGSPFTVFVGGDPNSTGGGTLRADRLADGRLSRSERSVAEWFDTSAFRAPALFQFGNSGRDILTGPGLVNFDASLFKDFNFSESKRLQFRGEVFNVFNHPQFMIPGQTINTPTFGVITSAGTAREMQLALKLYF